MNKYESILYDDIDEVLYVFKSFGKSIKYLPHFLTRPRSDLIIWVKSIDQLELLRDLHIRKDVIDTLRQFILDIIHGN